MGGRSISGASGMPVSDVTSMPWIGNFLMTVPSASDTIQVWVGGITDHCHTLAGHRAPDRMDMRSNLDLTHATDPARERNARQIRIHTLLVEQVPLPLRTIPPPWLQ